MKKIISFSILTLLIILTVGCSSSNKEQTLKCTLYTKDASQGYELNSSYEVSAKGENALVAKTTEEVTSENKTVLDYFEKTLNETYKAYNDSYGGYDYKVTKEGNKVTSVVTINYDNMNLEQFITDQPTMKSYMTKDNHLKITGLKSMYEQMGATCTLD